MKTSPGHPDNEQYELWHKVHNEKYRDISPGKKGLFVLIHFSFEGFQEFVKILVSRMQNSK